MCQLHARGAFQALDFGSRGILPLLLVVDDYNQAATANHKGTKAQRTPKRDSSRSTSFAILAGCGPAAPSNLAKMRRPLLAEVASVARIATMRSGLIRFLGMRLIKGGRSWFGPISQGLSREGANFPRALS